MIRRFGWLPETIPPSPGSLWTLRGESEIARPDTAHVMDSIDFEHAILDQGDTGSCVAQALAQAMRICTAASESTERIADVPLPSRRWIYRLARETHGAGDCDDGTYISAAITACQRLGWPSEERVPWSERNVCRGVSVADRRHAFDQVMSIREYAIISEAKIAQTKDAICGGYPIVFGADVDRQFVDCDDYTPQRIADAPVGGHAMVMIGYDPDGAIIVNSWGIDWGMGGIGRISWSGFSKRARDLRVITLVRRATT